jgi:hypothetical protein
MSVDNFVDRHIGPEDPEIQEMLDQIGVSSLNELMDQTLPASIRLQKELNIPAGMSEYEYLKYIRGIASKNKLFRSYIGMGYYNTITLSVIKRNILENPAWYTSYTPYQAEISQGRLEALLNFSTMTRCLPAALAAPARPAGRAGVRLAARGALVAAFFELVFLRAMGSCRGRRSSAAFCVADHEKLRGDCARHMHSPSGQDGVTLEQHSRPMSSDVRKVLTVSNLRTTRRRRGCRRTFRGRRSR